MPCARHLGTKQEECSDLEQSSAGKPASQRKKLNVRARCPASSPWLDAHNEAHRGPIDEQSYSFWGRAARLQPRYCVVGVNVVVVACTEGHLHVGRVVA